MKIIGIQGAAGTGETRRLTELVADVVRDAPLAEGQRVLALTFMHGAKHRLRDRMRSVQGLASRIDCLTFDGFAQRTMRRWTSLAKDLNLYVADTTEFDEQCENVGSLLERHEIRSWVAATYPIVVVDEAQDLRPQRLRMLRALSSATTMLVALDEFQCLDSSLRPPPAVEWLRKSSVAEVLTTVHRTSESELLKASNAIRAGQPPRSGKLFQILISKGPQMTAWHLANALAWGGTSNVAVLVPSKRDGYAAKIIDIISKKPCGKNKSGPYYIRWERADAEDVADATTALKLADLNTFDESVKALLLLPDSGPSRQTIKWLYYRRNAFGTDAFTRQEIENAFGRHYRVRNQHTRDLDRGFAAMTIHQAKNREFDGVVVMWTHAVGGDDDSKRRLLYNAVTRARRWCTVILPSRSVLDKAPFL